MAGGLKIQGAGVLLTLSPDLPCEPSCVALALALATLPKRQLRLTRHNYIGIWGQAGSSIGEGTD